MKHLLNNLTEQEKNSIREQHTGGMNVVTENFSRLINTKSGDVKPLVTEYKTSFGEKIQSESDLVISDKRVLSEGDESSCLISAKFTRESIGGPQTRQLVYEKTDNGVTYQIGMDNNVPTKNLTIITKNDVQVCTWSCDPSSRIGVKWANCKRRPPIFF